MIEALDNERNPLNIIIVTHDMILSISKNNHEAFFDPSTTHPKKI